MFTFNFFRLEDFNISVIRNPKETKRRQPQKDNKNNNDVKQKTLFDR